MKKRHLLLSAVVMGAAVLGFASSAKADAIKIVSKPKCDWWNPSDVGHTAMAFYDGNGRLVGTKGMWPGGVRTNDATDTAMANGNGGKCGGVMSRVAYVSRSRREWAQHAVASSGGTACSFYLAVGSKAAPGGCSCVNFGTRVWRQVTADRERWQLMLSPADVANQIWSANGGRTSGVFDGGRLWQ